MILKINAENLENQLLKGLNNSYFIIGKEEFFIQESKKILLKLAKKKQYFETISVYIKSNTDWQKIMNTYQDQSIFFTKKIIILIYKKDTLDNNFYKNFKKLSFLFNKNILFIMQFENTKIYHQKKNFFDQLQTKSTIIYCNTLKLNDWYNWVDKKILKMKLNINDNVKKLLYQNYEGNLFALSNILNIFALLYPSTEITLHQSKKIIEDLSLFTPVQWINAIFENKKKSLLK
ncbi:DNA polymerase III subunit delta [Buchnera aphidicola]|uniref:DNA polymerase III subunit delta n=1 Tax=Buchnera aphidicola TaxID=9 RepID=UPI0034640E17